MMENKDKLGLDDLKITSFATSIKQLVAVKGGGTYSEIIDSCTGCGDDEGTG